MNTDVGLMKKSSRRGRITREFVWKSLEECGIHKWISVLKRNAEYDACVLSFFYSVYDVTLSIYHAIYYNMNARKTQNQPMVKIKYCYEHKELPTNLCSKLTVLSLLLRKKSV